MEHHVVLVFGVKMSTDLLNLVPRQEKRAFKKIRQKNPLSLNDAHISFVALVAVRDSR